MRNVTMPRAGVAGLAGSAAGAGSQDGEGVGGQKVISLDFRGSFS